MKVKNDKLYHNNGSAISFERTPNKSGRLKNNKPRFIVIHFTANGSAKNTVQWFKNRDAKASAHLIVDHDGSLTQMVPFTEKAWHAGKSSWKGLTGLNSYSVGIEIVNWGGLQGDWGSWKTWTGKTIPDGRVIKAAHRNRPTQNRGWEIFDPEQIDATAEAVRALADAYDIGRNDIIGHDDIAPSRKTDPGPAWDMLRFRERVFGREEEGDDATALYTVTADSGLNLRVGPGVDKDKIKTLAHGSEVSVLEKADQWWFVAEIQNGNEDDTGWVYSRWLRPS